MDVETLTAEILQRLNGATQPITARQIFEGIASHVPMPVLASALHDLRVGGKIAGERQDGSRPLVYRALREGEAPNPASRVAPPVGGRPGAKASPKKPNGKGNGHAVDIKAELFEVIESMVDNNQPLLRLIRLYGRC